jgi:hypothetical protein
MATGLRDKEVMVTSDAGGISSSQDIFISTITISVSSVSDVNHTSMSYFTADITT